MANFIKVAQASAIPDQSALCVELNGQRIALFNLGGEFYAIQDACTHEGGPLSEGVIDGEAVECPWHGAIFNIRTGAVILDPADDPVATYRVRVTDDDIEIEI